MKKKRYWVKGFKKILALALIIVAIIVASNVIYDARYDNIAVDDEIKESYEIKEDKFKLLKTIAEDSVEEGKMIRINQISREGIQYKIYNSGENIILYYYIDEKINNEYPYTATITLSNNYEILDEEYFELEDFDTYREKAKDSQKIYSFFIVLYVLFMMTALFGACFSIYLIYNAIKKSKKQTNTNS